MIPLALALAAVILLFTFVVRLHAEVARLMERARHRANCRAAYALLQSQREGR